MAKSTPKKADSQVDDKDDLADLATVQTPFPPAMTGQPAWGTPAEPPPSAIAYYLRHYFARRHWFWLKEHDRVMIYGHLVKAAGDVLLLKYLLAKGDEAALSYQRERRRNLPHHEADERVMADVIAPEAGGEYPDPLPPSLMASYQELVASFERTAGSSLIQEGAV